MTLYPEEQKARLIERMVGPSGESVPALSRESGIPKDTLYGWRQQARRARGQARATPPERWSAAQKLATVVETAALNEAERAAYCRQRGLYPEQVQRWREVCEKANGEQAQAAPGAKGPNPQRRIHELERELRRKDKALAEAAALRVLRKKADAILEVRTRPYDPLPRSPPGRRADPGSALGGCTPGAGVYGAGD